MMNMLSANEVISSGATGRSYKVIKALGHGAFGDVLLAGDNSNPELQYAVKQLYMRDHEAGLPLPVQREVAALQQLQHTNIVSLVDVATAGPCFYLIQELCSTDLAAVLHATNRLLPPGVVKAITQQLLQGLAACHAHGLMHRDIKPSNVLITAGGHIKLADFGLARSYICSHAERQPESDDQSKPKQQQQLPACSMRVGAPNSATLPKTESPATHAQHKKHPQQQPEPVCRCFTSSAGTRWYRAPELLYGSCSYGPEVDVWAAGLLLAEVLGLAPLLPGQSDIDQLARMHQLLGSISLQDWPEAEQLPDWHKISFGSSAAQPLGEVLPDAPQAALDLLQQMLRYPPSQRVTASKALQHVWLTSGQPSASPDEVAACVRSIMQQEKPQMKLVAVCDNTPGWASSDDNRF